MGLFDGVGATSNASSAEVASLLDAPVVLVVDGSSMTSSVRAVVDGYHHHLLAEFARPLAGVILNRVGSDTHESLLREALLGCAVPVLGALRRDAALLWRDRHLGLVPVVEDPAGIASTVVTLGHAVAAGVDLAAIEAVARRAPPGRAERLAPARRTVGAPVAIAVLGGPAFSFCYPDNLERLAEAGGELIEVNPTRDRALPDAVAGVYACGGFPEVFAAELAENRPLLDDVAMKVDRGLAVWAECGGLLWLSRSLDAHRLCGAIPASSTLGSRVTVGYRTATLRCDTPIGGSGTVLRGHEHHYSSTEPPGEALELVGRAGTRLEGWATRRLLATYLHLHLGGDPGPAERFIATASDPISGPAPTLARGTGR